jgi:hypothetical protein
MDILTTGGVVPPHTKSVGGDSTTVWNDTRFPRVFESDVIEKRSPTFRSGGLYHFPSLALTSPLNGYLTYGFVIDMEGECDFISVIENTDRSPCLG